MTREGEESLFGHPVIDDEISDHSSMLWKLFVGKQKFERKQISYSKIKQIDLEEFKSDLRMAAFTGDDDSDSIIKKYNTAMQHILDKHAPIQTKTITIRPKASWITMDIKN